jgi:hypothetical protein
VECDVAAVSRRRELHDGGLPSVVVSACRVTFGISMTSSVWTVGECCGSASALLPSSSGVVRPC